MLALNSSLLIFGISSFYLYHYQVNNSSDLLEGQGALYIFIQNLSSALFKFSIVPVALRQKTLAVFLLCVSLQLFFYGTVLCIQYVQGHSRVVKAVGVLSAVVGGNHQAHYEALLAGLAKGLPVSCTKMYAIGTGVGGIVATTVTLLNRKYFDSFWFEFLFSYLLTVSGFFIFNFIFSNAKVKFQKKENLKGERVGESDVKEDVGEGKKGYNNIFKFFFFDISYFSLSLTLTFAGLGFFTGGVASVVNGKSKELKASCLTCLRWSAFLGRLSVFAIENEIILIWPFLSISCGIFAVLLDVFCFSDYLYYLLFCLMGVSYGAILSFCFLGIRRNYTGDKQKRALENISIGIPLGNCIGAMLGVLMTMKRSE